MDSLKPENVYIMRSDILGHKQISCVSEYTLRTHKNNSIRHRYLNGIYQDIPEIAYIDFTELAADTMDKVKSSKKNALTGGNENA